MIIVCHRDPDSSNDFVVFAEGQPAPRIIDIDYGRVDLRDTEEFNEWRDSLLDEVSALYKLGTPNAIEAGQHIANTVAEAIANYDHERKVDDFSMPADVLRAIDAGEWEEA
jgi:hypothetical protein